MVYKARFPEHSVNIAVAGKYTSSKTAYKSIWEALKARRFANASAVEVKYIDVEDERGRRRACLG